VTGSEGAGLTYRIDGEGDPLLLLMGLGAAGEAWAPHVAAWRGLFATVAVDNRGTGGSPVPPGSWTTAQMADDAAALVRALDLGPVRVVGISMGGAIAQELALRHPDLVQRLVITASWARCSPWTAQVLDALVTAQRELTAPEFTRLLQLMIWTPGYLEAHTEELASVRRDAETITAQAFAAQAAACRTHDTLRRLAQIEVPVLVTAGDRDVFVPLELSRELAGAIPGAELEVFAGSAHTHHWEELDRYNAFVGDWLT
jgi:pimeloyl-ACP methyl ester carboxylesterase